MPKTTEKPKDILDSNNVDPNKAPQTKAQEELATRVQELFRGAYNAKQQLRLPQLWVKCDDYKNSRQNPKQSEEHPGSVTNIIHPIIESQIADLIDQSYTVEADGREPSDDLYGDQTRHLMEFILERNNFKTKLNVSEHDRLELGSTVLKVYFDPDQLNHRGLPTFEVVSPANFFPDPKWSRSDLLQECEFIIHAVPRPLSWIRKKFPKLGKYVVRETSVPYDPEQFANQKSDETETTTSQKALLIECYMRDEKGELYCVHVANHIVLEDSRDVMKGDKLQRRNMYPFVSIPCYGQRGIGWGKGDVELLIPTQDLVNDMDDQIRMNARVMANPQIAVGIQNAKSTPLHKWTNKHGLRIPMRDVNAFRVVEGRNISSDVPQRREKAFEEANIISGRPDVNRGEAPGTITAASAIMALQQAGQKSVVHKREMFKQGWNQVLELLYDEMMDHWDEEMWVRVNGDKPDYKFYNPGELKQVPIMIPDDAAPEGQDPMKQLTDMVHDPETGMTSEVPMTREAEFDLRLTIGNGLANDTSFIYSTLAEWAKIAINGQPVISWAELRDYLRDRVGIPLQSDEAIQQQAMEQQMQAQMAMQPPGMMPPGMPPGAPQPMQLVQGGAM